MKLTSLALQSLFCLSIIACGSTTLERTDDESSLGGPPGAARSDGGSSTAQHDGGSSVHEGGTPSSGSRPDGTVSTSTGPATSGGITCAPGAECNGISRCYDDEFVVAGNGTCQLDCECTYRSSVNGTLSCTIWDCN